MSAEGRPIAFATPDHLLAVRAEGRLIAFTAVAAMGLLLTVRAEGHRSYHPPRQPRTYS